MCPTNETPNQILNPLRPKAESEQIQNHGFTQRNQIATSGPPMGFETGRVGGFNLSLSASCC